MARLHHNYVATNGAGDHAAYMHETETEDARDMQDVEIPLTPHKTDSNGGKHLTPAEKAKATRVRKEAEARARVEREALLQRRRDRYEEWAEKFPEHAKRRLMWLDRETCHWRYVKPSGAADDIGRRRIKEVPEHHRGPAPKRQPRAPVERRTFDV